MDTRVLHLVAFAIVLVTNSAIIMGYAPLNAAMPVYFVIGTVEAAYFVYAVSDPRTRVALAVVARSFSRASLVAEGIGIITLIISGSISFIIVAKMFPVIDSASYDLQVAASQSNNTLIKMLAPVIPYLIGMGLFIVLLIPINILVDTARRRLGGGAI